MESPKNEMNMRYTAEQLKNRLEKELPIMRQNYNSLQNIEGFSILPMVVHNISLCVSERVYLFIEPTLLLYKAVLPKRNLLGLLKRSLSGNEKEIEKRISFMDDLLRKELALYNEQLEEAKADIKREKKEQRKAEKTGNTAQLIPTLTERIVNFRHVEIDMYEFLYPYMVLVGRGEIEQNEQQIEVLQKMRDIATAILDEFIPKREQTLNTCNTILQSDVE